MTGEAGHASVHVNGVIEEGILGQLVHPLPFHGVLRLPAFPHLGKQRAGPLDVGLARIDAVVAVHAHLRVRHGGMLGLLHVLMAVAAIHAKLADVNLV